MVIWPMGCKKVKTIDEQIRLLNSDLYYAQPKIDGVRCIMFIDKEGNVSYTTRGSSVEDPSKTIDISHRLEHLPVSIPYLWDSILDGELFCEYLTSAKVAGMVSHRSTVEVNPDIVYKLFDVLKFRGKTMYDKTLNHRVKLMHNIHRELLSSDKIPKGIEIVRGTVAHKKELLEREFEAGREGIVVKNLSATYRIGEDKCLKPTNNWYKIKKKDTVDTIITGSLPPEEYYRDPQTNVIDLNRKTKPWLKGWIGSITFKFEENGVIYEGSCSGITDKLKERLSESHIIKPEYVGRCMEVEFFERTEDGNLRHPRFIRIREEIEK